VNEETRPRGTGHQTGGSGSSVPDLAAYRRRRAAAQRLAPYGDGSTDPLDGLTKKPIGERSLGTGVFSARGEWTWMSFAPTGTGAA
jgi:hypothetical protein